MSNRKVIKIGEHHVPLPPFPTDKRKIYLVDEPKHNAFWRRIPFSDFFYNYVPETKVKPGDPFTLVNQKATVWDGGMLLSLSETDTATLYREVWQDMYWRVYGFWMKNGDDIIWVAPGYYFGLQWGQMKDLPAKYGNFRWIQNDIMILWHKVKFDPNCAGLLVPKCKKSGLTQVFSLDFLNDSETNKGMELGAASKEFDHIKDVFMAYYFHAYDNQPLILQADVAKRNLSEIIFGKEVKRTGSKLRKGEVSDGERIYLGTRMNANKTKTNCLDGPVIKRAILDELPKWWEAAKISPGETLTKSVEAVKLNQKINGAIAAISYMPEFDDLGFHEFVQWCKKSFLSTKSEHTGRTESNLIVFPVAADMSNEECFDIHGRCDRKKAYAMVEQENASKMKADDKQAHRRQYPLTMAHFFDAGGRGTTFDNIRLGIQYREVDEYLRTGFAPYKYATLKWAKDDWNTGKRGGRPRGQFSPVIIEWHKHDDVMAQTVGEDFNVPFLFYDDIEPQHLNQVILKNQNVGQFTAAMRNIDEIFASFHFIRQKSNSGGHRHEDDDCLSPLPNALPGVISLDPVEYVLKKQVAEGTRSTNAAHGGFIYDAVMDSKMARPYTNVPLIDYYFRCEDPDEDYENLVKLIILTGWYVIVESNKKWVVTNLFKDGLHHFCILKRSDGTISPYRPGDEVMPVSATQEFINDYCRRLNRWMAPVKHNTDFDYIKSIKRLKTLTQLMSFDPMDTKPFDLAVSLGWWRIGMDAVVEYILEKKEEGREYSSEAMGAAFQGLGLLGVPVAPGVPTVPGRRIA